MQSVYSYNFNETDIQDENFAALFNQRRRDSTYAFAYEKDGDIYALRDPMGIVPLFYRFTQNSVRFASNLTDLIKAGDEFDTVGLSTYLKFGTVRLVPLIKGIEIVPPGVALKLDPISQTRQVVYSYEFRPRQISRWTGMSQLVGELENLFIQAIKRLVRHDEVGLYLSGGIDSALIGIYLHKLGVKVNAYTSAPWGPTSSEIPFAETNAQIAQVAHHTIDILETDAYQPLAEELPRLFGVPHGSSTALGVASLWKNTDIASEKQVFLGQNSDTMFCCVPAQNICFFMQFLPRIVRRKLHPRLRYSSLAANYLSFTRGFTGDPAQFHCPAITSPVSAIQELIFNGMFVVHTPVDGEVLTQPAINHNIATANPFCDLDIVEFAMGIPLQQRITITRSSKIGLALEKRILRQLALRYLPKEVVSRKKGFTVSFERDKQAQQLAQKLPDEIRGNVLKRLEERFAAQILINWQDLVGIDDKLIAENTSVFAGVDD
jgi:asparagine synthetase B (glutamine-hydrolysing)